MTRVAAKPVPTIPGHAADTGDAVPDSASSLYLAHTDWLHHRLAITGPESDVAALRAAVAGAGIIPWHLDCDRMEEDFLHLLISPPAPQRRSLSVAGARILARQLREAVAYRHELAASHVGRSHACPFDLHALLPVPDAILRLGPDDPAALAWLWRHWGTTHALRRVAEDVRQPGAAGPAVFRVTFWSADWTPWRALRHLAAGWPTLRFDCRPSYEAA